MNSRKFQYVSDVNGLYITVTVNERYIRQTYWDYWLANVPKEKIDKVSFNDCAKSFCLRNSAVEIY